MMSFKITWELGKYVKLDHIATWNIPNQKSEEPSCVYLQLCKRIWMVFQIHAFDSYPLNSTRSTVALLQAAELVKCLKKCHPSKQSTCVLRYF